LKQYSEAMRIFIDNLKAEGRTEDVMVIPFLEFGRRVRQNGSNGTNYNTANNVFMMVGRRKPT
jgi:uncharacterized protein (DUF1501 family)